MRARDTVVVVALLVSGLALGSCVALPPPALTSSEMKELSTPELIHRFLELDMYNPEARPEAFEAITSRPFDEVFSVIANIFNESNQGRSPGKSLTGDGEAFSAMALLWRVDNNVVRVRSQAGGPEVLVACRHRLERKAKAGDDREPKRYNDAAYSRYMVYRGESEELEGMLHANGRDAQIATQLERDYSITLSQDERDRFSDFLTAKDPRYVAWSPLHSEPFNPYIFDNFEPFYRAYLEFKKAEMAKR